MQDLKKIYFKGSHYYHTKTYLKTSISKDLTLFSYASKAHKNLVAPKSYAIPLLKNTLPKSQSLGRHYMNPYYYFKNKNHLKDYVILGIGGNIEKKDGDCMVRFWKLFKRIRNKNAIIFRATILKNPAFGYTQQNDFYNTIIWLKTKLGIVDFWSFCAYLERLFQRERKRPFKNAPRTLDLDIIGFKNKIIRLNTLKIPHIAWNQRPSVRIVLFGRNV